MSDRSNSSEPQFEVLQTMQQSSHQASSQPQSHQSNQSNQGGNHQRDYRNYYHNDVDMSGQGTSTSMAGPNTTIYNYIQATQAELRTSNRFAADDVYAPSMIPRPIPRPGTVYLDQERYLPIANVTRVMKTQIDDDGKLAREAKECIQECVSEFIGFISSEAATICQSMNRKTITADDLLTALEATGFDNYSEPMRVFLMKYRQAHKISGPIHRTHPNYARPAQFLNDPPIQPLFFQSGDKTKCTEINFFNTVGDMIRCDMQTKEYLQSKYYEMTNMDREFNNDESVMVDDMMIPLHKPVIMPKAQQPQMQQQQQPPPPPPSSQAHPQPPPPPQVVLVQAGAQEEEDEEEEAPAPAPPLKTPKKSPAKGRGRRGAKKATPLPQEEEEEAVGAQREATTTTTTSAAAPQQQPPVEILDQEIVVEHGTDLMDIANNGSKVNELLIRDGVHPIAALHNNQMQIFVDSLSKQHYAAVEGPNGLKLWPIRIVGAPISLTNAPSSSTEGDDAGKYMYVNEAADGDGGNDDFTSTSRASGSKNLVVPKNERRGGNASRGKKMVHFNDDQASSSTPSSSTDIVHQNSIHVDMEEKELEEFIVPNKKAALRTTPSTPQRVTRSQQQKEAASPKTSTPTPTRMSTRRSARKN